MSAELEFDEETSRLVEAVYLTPDVAATRHAVLRALDLRHGPRIRPGPTWLPCARPDLPCTALLRRGHYCGFLRDEGGSTKLWDALGAGSSATSGDSP